MSLHDDDYVSWTQTVADDLRAGRGLRHEDAFELAEEIEDLGKSERRSLRSAVKQLYMHMLKLKYQPEMATRSWHISIENQQQEVADIIEDNKGLKPLLNDEDFISRAYRAAVTLAAIETNLPKETFPADCPFTYEDFEFPDSQTPASSKRQAQP